MTMVNLEVSHSPFSTIEKMLWPLPEAMVKDSKAEPLESIWLLINPVLVLVEEVVPAEEVASVEEAASAVEEEEAALVEEDKKSFF